MAEIEVESELTGNVWKIEVKEGDKVTEGTPLLILESMKMEIPVSATEDGTLTELIAEEGQTVTEGTVVARIEV